MYLDRARYDVPLAQSLASKVIQLQTAVTRAQSALDYLNAAQRGGWPAADAEVAFRVHAMQALAQAGQLVECPSCAPVGVMDATQLDQLPTILMATRGVHSSSALTRVHAGALQYEGYYYVSIACPPGDSVRGVSHNNCSAAYQQATTLCTTRGGTPGEITDSNCAFGM